MTKADKTKRYLQKKSVKDFLKTNIKSLNKLQKDRKIAGKHNKILYQEIVIEPLEKIINTIIKTNKQQDYADCSHRKYYVRINPPQQRPPTDMEVERELLRFLDWMKFKETYYSTNLYGAYFERLAKPLYEEWEKQKIPWPDFPFEVPPREVSSTTYPFSSNDLNHVRGFITGGLILYTGLQGNIGNYDMKCKTFAKSNVDNYIEFWKFIIKENTGVDWSDL